jgi:hemoglobin-like flavoprotein
MTLKQIELVRRSFAHIKFRREEAAALFYRRLFELDPSLRPLFKEDLKEQGTKLMQMLGLAVTLIEQPQMLQPALEALGRRHSVYGVKSEHYDIVGKALILTLGEALEDAFTTEVRDAWLEVYFVIATAMQKASLITKPVAISDCVQA